jgi:hypothetical protein
MLLNGVRVIEHATYIAAPGAGTRASTPRISHP